MAPRGALVAAALTAACHAPVGEDVTAFTVRATAPLSPGVQFDAANRYLGTGDLLKTRSTVTHCRSYQSAFARVSAAAQRAGFHRDYESIAPVVPGDIPECISFVRDTERATYSETHAELPSLSGKVDEVRDVFRFCLHIEPQADLCRFTEIPSVARWSEHGGERFEHFDQHRDDLIAEVERLLAVCTFE